MKSELAGRLLCLSLLTALILAFGPIHRVLANSNSDQTSMASITLEGQKGNGKWYRSDVTVKLSLIDDEGGTGVADTHYSLNEGVTWLRYRGPFSINQEGSTLLQAKMVDGTGNTETHLVSFEIAVDKTPPNSTLRAQLSEIRKVRKGYLVQIPFGGIVYDSVSGLSPLTTIQLIDEYGTFTRTIPNFTESVYEGGWSEGWYANEHTYSGYVLVEAWSEGWDRDGRTYTIRQTAIDHAGNESISEVTAVVTHVGGTAK